MSKKEKDMLKLKKKETKKKVQIEEIVKNISTASVLKFDRVGKQPDDYLSYFGLDDENQDNDDQNNDDDNDNENAGGAQ